MFLQIDDELWVNTANIVSVALLEGKFMFYEVGSEIPLISDEAFFDEIEKFLG